jgi:hypothetical protein
MNSAMMPQTGTYKCRYITEEEFRQIYKNCKASGGTIESLIGYPETAYHVSQLVGERIFMSRNETVLENKDIMLVCKLPYRPKDPNNKDQIKPTEYSYAIVEYEENNE